jgi:ectoine hydroxylase-related dioxygenase (phytanoyl-CoA dioxygenase family)
MKFTAEDWHRTKPWIDREDCDIPGYVAQVAHPEDYNLREKLEFWREHGVVIFERAVDPLLLDALQEDLAHLIAHSAEFDVLIEHAGQQKPVSEFTPAALAGMDRLKFCNIQTVSRAAARLSLTRAVTSFLSHIFRDAPCVLQSLLFNRGSQQPLHLDYPYVRTQRHLACLAASWIPLEDIHADAGPLAYYCGSQRPEILPFFDWGDGNIIMDETARKQPMEFSNYLSAEMTRLGIKPKIFRPKRGDVLIWHAYLAHEGTAIRNPSLTRKSFVTHYTSLASYPPLHRSPDAIAAGCCLQENGGYAFDFPWIKNPRRLPSWSRAG